MQFKTFEDIFREGAQYHDKASNDQSLLKAERSKLYAMAEFSYNRVLEEDPDCVPALSNLGTLYTEIGRWGVGLALLQRALQLEPTFDAYNSLGATYRRCNKPEKARDFLLKAIEMRPKDSYALHNMAGTFINEGDPEAALRWARRAVEADPTNSNHKLTLGLAQLEMGDYANGWANCEIGRKETTWNGRNYPDVEHWNGEPGKNIVVFGEQGVGDEILFASCLPDLINISKSVVIDCHPRLTELMKRSFPQCVVHGTRKDEHITWNPKDYGIEAKVPIGSLPSFFRQALWQFPQTSAAKYIKPDPVLVERYRKPGLRIGLSWIGGTKQTHVMYRSIEPERLGPLLTIPGIDWVSLQYTPGAAEDVEKMRQLYGCKIEHDKEINEGTENTQKDRHGNPKGDLDKLFGTIASLDLVVTTLQSNIHFAGSMGVPCWCLTPIRAPWQFTTPTIPFYPQHRIFRQTRDGNWDSVLWNVAGELRKLTIREAAE